MRAARQRAPRQPKGFAERDDGQTVVEVFGTQASFREESDWAAGCPQGGELLKTFMCIGALGDAGAPWQFGRLYVGEHGLLFAVGAGDGPELFKSSTLLRWSLMEEVDHWPIGVVDREVALSLGKGADDGAPSRLAVRMAAASVNWLAEVWKFVGNAGRDSSPADDWGRATKKMLTRRATTMTFIVPGVLGADEALDAPHGLTRSGSDSCLLQGGLGNPTWLPGQLEPEEEASPGEESEVLGADLDERGRRILGIWSHAQELCRVSPQTAKEAWASLQTLTDWHRFDVFALGEMVPRPMALIGHAVLAGLGHLDTLDLPVDIVHRVLSAWETGYRKDVAFHTSLHAGNVTQAVYHSLAVGDLGTCFTPRMGLSMLLASLVHDVGHPGVNNHFLVSSRDPVALHYNEKSVLENLHSALSQDLLDNSGVDLFYSLGREGAAMVRRTMTKIILDTDMATHKQSIASVSFLSCREDFAWDDPETQSILASALVHSHDVSNPTRPWENFVEWTNRVMEEFFCQADLERQLGLDFSGGLSRGYAPLDRTKPFNVPLFQLGFARNVVQPLVVVLGSVPGISMACQMDCLTSNIDQLEEESTEWCSRNRPGSARPSP